ncbi:hypothetical protein ACOSP7_023349 [Xanthoceras sorbifolium]
MDFGVLGLDGLVAPENGAPSTQVSLNPETMAKVVGSRSGKQERSGPCEDDRGHSKMTKTGDFSGSRTMPLHQGTPLLRSNSVVSGDTAAVQQQQMLSFSSNKSEVPFLSRSTGLVDRSSQIAGFPYYQNTPSAYTRSAGYGSGSLNPSMHGPVSGARGPFTQSQWIELEQQALIYKYINANVPVPSNLLIPLKKSLNPYGLSYSSAGSYVPTSYGWGTFHLGYSGSTDPEPGRCRRTDGKKWRCSRDAVPDQKYCERHINRGRHRSRKPVEGQPGQAASGTTTSNVVPTTSSMSKSVITSGSSSNSLSMAQQQLKTLQPGAANPSADPLVNRVQEPRSLPMMSSTINLKSDESSFSIPKQDIAFDESSQSVFGLVSSDSLLNPSQRRSLLNSKSYGGSYLDFSDQQSQDQQPVRQFIAEWPNVDESNHSVMTWSDELKSDWTQLSMSIPMSHSEFSSSSSSPAHEKFALSPLRLSREFDPVQMGSGMIDLTESMQKQTNWIPITYGSSMGGPLGEALTNPINSVGTCKNQSSLNLLTEGWDGSPHFGSSPTGVLHKSTFCSLSNSSSASSPIAENKKTHDGASLCDDVLGSTHVSSSSAPSV